MFGLAQIQLTAPCSVQGWWALSGDEYTPRRGTQAWHWWRWRGRVTHLYVAKFKQ